MKKLKKAASGLQDIQTKDAKTRQVLTSTLSTGLDTVLPGAGSVLGAVEGLSGLLKDENGLYKSGAGRVLDSLNPITSVGRVGRGLGQLFSGKKIDVDNEAAIKKQIEQKRNAKLAGDYYSTIKADPSTLQMGQYKQGSKKVSVKPIEMEGKEPLFSKKVNGQRSLKLYDPQGPTHAEGGIKILAEEGDAIVTAKKGMGAKAVAAHLQGNHAAVEKIIQKMPEDKPTPKYPKGTKKVAAKTPRPTSLARPSAPVMPTADSLTKSFMGDTNPLGAATLEGLMKPRPFINAPAQGTVTPSVPGVAKKPIDYQSNAMNALTAAPTLFNLGQGLFGKVEKTERRTSTPILNTYEDSSQPTRRASRAVKNAQVANARNLSGGSAGNVRANANQAFADDFSRQQSIDNTEYQKKTIVQQGNNALTNEATVRNNQINDVADNLDLQNQAKKSEALAKGMEGIGALASNSLLTKNMKAADAQNIRYLSDMAKNFTIVDGKVVMRKMKKGTKAIKK